jgi:hypothetical protein
MSLSAHDANRVIRRAARALQERPGQHIDRLTGDISSELALDDRRAVRHTLIDNWEQINRDAGFGQLFRADLELPANAHEQLNACCAAVAVPLASGRAAAACLGREHMDAAGTTRAREHEMDDDVFSVHGPEYWDIDPDSDIRNLGLFRRMTEPLVRWSWVRESEDKKLRGISGAEIEALTETMAGEPARLRPGDCLINGGCGDPSHIALYAGKDEQGRPMIIHSMATNNEGRTWFERLKDALMLPFTKSKTGVLFERLADFFCRYHRDTVAIARFPNLSQQQIAQGLAHARSLVGDAYDYKLAAGTDAIYCTEVYLEFLKAAVGGARAKYPYMGTSFHRGGGPLGIIGVRAFVCEPAHVLVSPHMEIGTTLGGGAKAVQELHRTHVLGPGAKRTLDTSAGARGFSRA